MSSLYKRASTEQRRLLRMIEGAVKNAADAHPGAQVNARFGRSVAKRAVGTISAHWQGMVGADQPKGAPASAEQHSQGNVCAEGAAICRTAPGALTATKRSKRKGRSRQLRSAPALRRLHKLVSQQIGPAKWSGQTERMEALIEVCRMIKKLA